MIEFEKRGAVGVITLNRPPVNAFNEELVSRLEAVVEQVSLDEELCAVVFQTSQRIFSAGADIKMIAGFLAGPDPGDKLADFAGRMQALNDAIATLPIPTVAAMRGGATGGGLELALACDFRITSRHAKIGLPESTLGLVPGAGGTQRLTRLIGHSNAMRMVLSGELVDGATAMDLGIVGWCVEDSEVDGEAVKLVETFVGRPRSVLAANKLCVDAASGDDGYEIEVEMTRKLIGEPAAQELIGRFISTRRVGAERSGQDGAAVETEGLTIDRASGVGGQVDAEIGDLPRID